MLRALLLRISLLGLLAGSAPIAAADFPSYDPDYPPPPDWTGRVFELSQDYPQQEPAAETYPWEAVDFTLEPFVYLQTVLAYGVEGNPGVDWEVAKNTIRPWFHAPWMQAGCGGREFIRGMTRERSSRPGELHPNQADWTDNWAVGFYNPPGGYTVGQVWADPDNPDPTLADFPVGTVGMKLLFTAATVEEVPYLENSLVWDANVYPAIGSNPCSLPVAQRPRVNRELRLLQLDLAIRDSRSEETGWVFGTFIYDASQEGATPFDRLVPVGVMWGNDPGITKDMNEPGAFVNSELAENVVNDGLIRDDSFPENRAFVTHFGLGGRVNGPVDNPISSCMSCHGLAASPGQRVVPGGSPADYTEEDLEHYFANVPPGATDEGSFVRLDYSLQLGFGIRSHALCTNDPSGEGCATTSTEVAAVRDVPLEPGEPLSRDGGAAEAVEQGPAEISPDPPPVEKTNSRTLWLLLGGVLLLGVLIWLLRRP